MGRFKTIKGLSEQRRLPRLGYLRLGKKLKRRGNTSCKCGPEELCNKCSYPTEVKHFIVPPEVAKVYGNEPMELDIALPLDATEDTFSQALKMYKSYGLYCEGNGEKALRRNDEGQWDERSCPCPHLDVKGGCKKVGNLRVILPLVSWGGIYEIVTSSINSMIDVQSGIDYIRSLIGRVVLVDKVKLLREPTPTTHIDPKTRQARKQTHYTMKIRYTGDEDDLKRERLRTGEVLGRPAYLIADEDRTARHMPDLIETSAPEVGADGSEVVDMEGDLVDMSTGEVLNAEPVAPGEGDDAKPAAAEPAKPDKKSSKKGKKSAKPKPKKPSVPASEKPITQAQVKKLWEAVQIAWGEGRLDEAKNFWGFFLKEYCAVEGSSDIPVNLFKMHLPELQSIGNLNDAEQRGVAMVEMVRRLQEVIAQRKADEAE